MALAEDRDLKFIDIPLKGRLITSLDPALIGNNYQTLQNLRYTDDGGLEGVCGTSKINSSAISTYVYIKNLFHFRKDQKLVVSADRVAAESHVLAFVSDSSNANTRIRENTTAIPSAGAFSDTDIYANTDTSSSAGLGRFSKAPQESVAYCDGVHAMIWGGNEAPVAAFICVDQGDPAKVWDYTKYIQNTLSDAANVATLQASADGAANTSLLLHMNGNDESLIFTDSSATGHVPTPTNAEIDVDQSKFGSASGKFASGYLTITRHADFDFSGGPEWSIDTWIRPTSSGAKEYYYYHQTDASNYMALYKDTDNQLHFRIFASGSAIVAMDSVRTISANAWSHIGLECTTLESVQFYVLYMNNAIEAFTTDSRDPVYYTGDVYIGANSAGANSFTGWMDEYRIKKGDALYGGLPYTPATVAYTADMTAVVMVGSTRQLSGVKFYPGTANTSTSSVSCQYYSSGALKSVSTLADGTASAGKTLAVDGVVSFTATTDATLTFFHGLRLYWYIFTFSLIDAGTTIYHAAIQAPMQGITDIWDGIKHIPVSFLVYKTNSYQDYSVNVFEDLWDENNDATYAELGTLPTTGYIIAQFTERQTALWFNIVGGKGNTTAATAAYIYYWNGSAWTLVTNQRDEMVENGVSVAKSGALSWDAPTQNSEIPLSIAKGVPFYSYKITFSKALSTNCQIYHVSGMPAAKQISDYKFPFFWADRLCLMSDQSEFRNGMWISSLNTNCVFNGSDSAFVRFGNNTDLVAAGSIYTRLSDSFQESAVILKQEEIWQLDGTGPGSYRKLRISDSHGCNAALSLQNCDLGPVDTGGINRHVLLWQCNEGIVQYDGQTIKLVSKDIGDLYDPNDANYIGDANLPNTRSFYDPVKREYHVLLWTSTPQEYVYDVVREGWFKMLRSGTATRLLRCGCIVTNTNGIQYNYGGDYAGYLMRLETGQSNDEAAIPFIIQTGDLNLLDTINIESVVRFVKLRHVAKNTTTNTLNISHYGDSASAASTPSLTAQAVSDSAKRLKTNIWAMQFSHVLHSFKFSISTSNETFGFEPQLLSILYKVGYIRTT